MTINTNKNGTSLTVTICGRLDTTTAPELEKSLSADLGGITELTLDFAELEYISSAGLRVILSLQKTMNKQGKMVLTHVSENVMEVFDITGFSDILTFED